MVSRIPIPQRAARFEETNYFCFFAGFSDFPQLTDIIRANYDYWKEQNDREEEEEANANADKKLGAASAVSTEDTLKEATEEEETTAESSHRKLDDIPSIDDDDN